MVAVAKRRPAKRNDGRNSRPIFIPSHVLPQIMQSALKTRPGAFDCKCLASPAWTDWGDSILDYDGFSVEPGFHTVLQEISLLPEPILTWGLEFPFRIRLCIEIRAKRCGYSISDFHEANSLTIKGG